MIPEPGSTFLGLDATSVFLGVAFVAVAAVIMFVVWLQEPSARSAKARVDRQARRAVREAEKIVKGADR